MSVLIQSDDLETGMHIMVMGYHVQTLHMSRSDHKVMKMGVNGPVQPGVPLKIIGVTRPFILCTVINPGGSEGGPIILDTRKANFTRPSEEYLQALINFSEDEAELDFEEQQR